MKNYVQHGERLDLAAPYAVTSGQGALIGATFGVAVTDLANGATGAFTVVGAFTLTKATGASTGGAQGAHYLFYKKLILSENMMNMTVVQNFLNHL